jgi:hypothetical protein
MRIHRCQQEYAAPQCSPDYNSTSGECGASLSGALTALVATGLW